MRLRPATLGLSLFLDQQESSENPTPDGPMPDAAISPDEIIVPGNPSDDIVL
jgi:hypothetical protein